MKKINSHDSIQKTINLLTKSKSYRFGKILCITSDYIISYLKGYVYIFNKKNNQIILKKQIISGISKFSLFSRIFRKEPRCAALINDQECIISHCGKVLRYNFMDNSLIEEHKYIKGMTNPLNFCVVDIPKRKDKTIYYGEYFSNKHKLPVSIYKRESSKWEKIYEFNRNTIKHIHNIVYDYYRNVFYVLTGDSDNESGIWFSDDNFKQVKPLYVGKQQCRTCMVIPTKECLLYATDTPIEENWIIKIFMDNMSVKSIQKIHSLPGPCIYGSKIGDQYLFSTSVEPDSSLPMWQYLLTGKLGKGIVDKYAHLFLLDKTDNIREILKGKKDFLPMGLLQFGTYQFPYNTTKNIVITTQALSIGHGKTFFLNGEQNENFTN